jgi:hypothetical protein
MVQDHFLFLSFSFCLFGGGGNKKWGQGRGQKNKQYNFQHRLKSQDLLIKKIQSAPKKLHVQK